MANAAPPHAHSHAFILGGSHSAAVLRLYEEWNRDPISVGECMERHGFVDTKNYVLHFLNTGDSFDWNVARQMQPEMMRAFTNLTMSVCELIESGDRVAARLMMSGIHTGTFVMGPKVSIPPSGRFFRSYANLSFRFTREGKIAEVYMLTSLLDALRQATEDVKAGK